MATPRPPRGVPMATLSPPPEGGARVVPMATPRSLIGGDGCCHGDAPPTGRAPAVPMATAVPGQAGPGAGPVLPRLVVLNSTK